MSNACVEALPPQGDTDGLTDAYGEKLLKIFDEIRPDQLGTTSYGKYVTRTKEAVGSYLKHDATHFLLLLQAIKDCKGPSYKRNVLLEVLSLIIYSEEPLIDNILCETFRPSCKIAQWKEMANAIASLPDLVANCEALKKISKFKAENFYAFISSKVLCSLKILFDADRILRYEQKLFFLQLVGRIALSGNSQLVWEKFFAKTINNRCDRFRRFVGDIFTIPIQSDSQMSTQFEIFIEPLYVPMFYNLKPTKSSGELIFSILADKILSHEFFKYLICNKAVLQTNFTHDRHHQKVILFNTFSYLSRLANRQCDLRGSQRTEQELSMDEEKRPSLLTETLLEIAQSWSNSAKVLLRPHEHNRFISCALVIAFKFALNYDKRCLAEHAEAIQSEMMRGIPVYLNRASSEDRNLAMCLGETLFPKLHELIDGHLSNDHSAIKRKTAELNFDVKWDKDCLEIKKLFQFELENIFLDFDKVDYKQENAPNPDSSTSFNTPTESCGKEDDGGDENDTDESGDESVPIYLRDCINGLVENNNPRYVRLCLIKANALIRQLLEQEAMNDKAVEVYKQDKYVNDSIRDIAIEFTQVLLYLDNQLNIDGFDGYRMNAMTSLCLSAPDLVAKYLLDEFNRSNRNTRHQLDVLQVLVAASKQLSSEQKGANKFVKYAPLFFYGIAHQLETNLRILPTTIISVAKALETERSIESDDSYLLSRILFSISLLIKCLNQQPITCKLSNDLIDILAAYKCHPDSGVRKAIVSCLTVIRGSTPSVYFEENLHDKLTSLFGPWLVNESELIKQLKLRDK